VVEQLDIIDDEDMICWLMATITERFLGSALYERECALWRVLYVLWGEGDASKPLIGRKIGVGEDLFWCGQAVEVVVWEESGEASGEVMPLGATRREDSDPHGAFFLSLGALKASCS
jgi:hypothetical protein